MSTHNGDYTRREFMAKPLTYLTSAGLIGLGAEELLRAADSAPAPKLIMRPLGKTGISLPIISMGVMNAEAPGLIVRSYEVGIRHFDTAASYQGGETRKWWARRSASLECAIRSLFPPKRMFVDRAKATRQRPRRRC
ncbi:MAG: hypothetical protein WB763_07460 [Terriglobia bacterium]